MANDLTLYTHPMRGRIVRWMLEEVGQAYRTEPLLNGMVDSETLGTNSKGSLPAIRHGKVVVTGVPTICAYLADLFPAARLAPTREDELRGAYHRWLFFAAGPAEVAISSNVLGLDIAAGWERMAGYGTFAAMLDGLEAAVSWGDYLLGEQFTAADLFVGAQLGFGMKTGMIEPRPMFEAYWGRLYTRSAYQRAIKLAQAMSPLHPHLQSQ